MTCRSILISVAFLVCLITSDGMGQTFKGLTPTDVQPLQVITLVPEPMEPPIDRLKNKGGSYTVLVINSTQLTVRRIKFDDGAWVSAQKIRRTCERNDFQWCFENKQWAVLATVDCGSEHMIEIEMSNSDGEWFRSKESWRMIADCEHLGGVLGLTE